VSVRQKLASLAAVSLLVAGCSVAALPPYSMAITFSGYANNGSLTNFPALVVFSNGMSRGFSYNGFLNPSGYDLRFWTNNNLAGMALNYEIDSWSNNGISYVWVQIPVLTSNETIWASWGNSSDHAQPACSTNGAVWNNGYAAVWHLGSGGTLSGNDATTNRNTGTTISATATTGMIGGCGNFVKNSSQRLTTAASPASLMITSNLTIEAWINASSFSAVGRWDNTIVGCDYEPQSGYVLRCGMTPGVLSFTFGLGSSWGEAYESSGTMAAGVWYHVVGRYDSQTVKIYVDGKEMASVNQTGSIAGSLPNGLSIGAGYNTGSWSRYFDGMIDEVRISSVARSSNWVWACYMNQGSNSVFNTYGQVIRTRGEGVFIR